MLNNILNFMNKIKKEAFEKVGIPPEYDKVICKNCKNSKIIIQKNGKSYEYSYDENGKQTLEIK